MKKWLILFLFVIVLSMSVYAGGGFVNCGDIITEPGQYELQGTYGKGIYSPKNSQQCILIKSSDVVLNCKGAIIDCDEGSDCSLDRAILIQNNSNYADWQTQISDVVIKNCGFDGNFKHYIEVVNAKEIELLDNNYVYSIPPKDSPIKLSKISDLLINGDYYNYLNLEQGTFYPSATIEVENKDISSVAENLEIKNTIFAYSNYPFICDKNANFNLENNFYYSLKLNQLVDVPNVNLNECSYEGEELNLLPEEDFFFFDPSEESPGFDLGDSDLADIFFYVPEINFLDFLSFFSEYNLSAQGGGSVQVVPLNDCRHNYGEDNIIMQLSHRNHALSSIWHLGIEPIGEVQDYALCYVEDLSLMKFLTDYHECEVDKFGEVLEGDKIVSIQSQGESLAQKLNEDTNVHVEYFNPVCYSEKLDHCVLAESDASCPGERGCVLELSSESNAYVAACGYGLDYKVCCEGQDYDYVKSPISGGDCDSDTDCISTEFCAVLFPSAQNTEIKKACVPFAVEGEWCADDENLLWKCGKQLECQDNVCVEEGTEQEEEPENIQDCIDLYGVDYKWDFVIEECVKKDCENNCIGLGKGTCVDSGDCSGNLICVSGICGECLQDNDCSGEDVCVYELDDEGDFLYGTCEDDNGPAGYLCKNIPDEILGNKAVMTCDPGYECYEGDPNIGGIWEGFDLLAFEPNCCVADEPYCVLETINAYGNLCTISEGICNDPDGDGIGTQTIIDTCHPENSGTTQPCTIYKGDNGLPFFGYLAGMLTLVILAGFYFYRNRKV